MVVPFKKLLRDAFEQKLKVGLCMAKRFIRAHRNLSSQINDSSRLAGGLLGSHAWKNKSEGAATLPRFWHDFDVSGFTS